MASKNAIVLKQISPHKIALLDREQGRIDGISFKPPLLGALIEYRVDRERADTLFIGGCSILDLPFFLARSDILFWHHVLELCYHFVPIGSHVPELFELLLFLYTVEKGSFWGIQAKKLYLFKLLSMIGLQPELPKIPEIQRCKFVGMPLEKITNERLEKASEKMIDEWLRVCVSEHPAIEQFNTMHFLVGE